jgi:hypothetical protein
MCTCPGLMAESPLSNPREIHRHRKHDDSHGKRLHHEKGHMSIVHFHEARSWQKGGASVVRITLACSRNSHTSSGSKKSRLGQALRYEMITISAASRDEHLRGSAPCGFFQQLPKPPWALGCVQPTPRSDYSHTVTTSLGTVDWKQSL